MNTNTTLPKPSDSIADSESYSILQAYDEGFIQDLALRGRRIALAEGEYLYNQGDDADLLYFILEGLLQTVIRTDHGKKSTVKELAPGDIVGVIAVLSGGKRNNSVYALTPSVLLVVPRRHLDDVLPRYPRMRNTLLEITSQRLKRTLLAEVLPEYFEEMDESAFDYIESLFQWVHIKRGDVLYEKDDIGDCLYILVNGLLHVIDYERNDTNRVLAIIDRGKIVGELAMLSDEKRTASIYAARDCDLVKLSRDAFENISEQFPQVMMAITRILVDRLKNIRIGQPNKAAARIFTVLPITPGVPVEDFSFRLATAFSRLGLTFVLTPKVLDRFLDRVGISGITEEDPRDTALRAYLAEIETSHSFIIYMAEAATTAWTRRCLKRADHVLLVADAGSSPKVSALEKGIEGDDNQTTTPRKSLILLHPDTTDIPLNTSPWLDERILRGHYHIRWDREQDFGRLARILCNRAVGLVLGGGAAKGIAHVGVIRALQEAGIPIDMVGGSSMGSIIGAHFAMGNGYDNMLELCKKLFIEINPFNEYTLPLVSLMRGRKLEKMGKLAYGETEVEDLWLNFFCVSSNLTTSQIKVHRRGSLWKAVRTSSSIPGIISPVLVDGEIFVDGGVINNLPGDIMRRQCGVVIVVEVSPNLDMTAKVSEIPSPWKLLWRKLIPFKNKLKIPGIVDIILSTVLTGSFIAANSVKRDADLSISPPLTGIGFLEFKKMKKAAEIGYEHTKRELEKITEPGLLACLRGEKKAD